MPPSSLLEPWLEVPSYQSAPCTNQCVDTSPLPTNGSLGREESAQIILKRDYGFTD